MVSTLVSPPHTSESVAEVPTLFDWYPLNSRVSQQLLTPLPLPRILSIDSVPIPTDPAAVPAALRRLVPGPPGSVALLRVLSRGAAAEKTVAVIRDADTLPSPLAPERSLDWDDAGRPGGGSSSGRCGLGMTFTRRAAAGGGPPEVVVRRLKAGDPAAAEAAAGGVAAGDAVRSISGTEVGGLDDAGLARLVLGPPGQYMMLFSTRGVKMGASEGPR
jgi:hypothetical protein